MVTGPQSMPVFNDANITPENKRDIIAFLHDVDKNENPGGLNLGNLGPGLRGAVRLDLRHRHPHRLRRLARHEGRVTMTRRYPTHGARLHHCETTGSLTR